MGCCSSDDAEDEGNDGQGKAYKSMDDAGGVSNFATPSLQIPDGDKQHLLSVDENGTHIDDEQWNEQQTEQLEHELEKEITIQQYKQSRDEKLLPKLDDGESHGNKDEHASGKPNLFRYESDRKGSWKVDALDGEADSMQEQMDRLAKQQANET